MSWFLLVLPTSHLFEVPTKWFPGLVFARVTWVQASQTTTHSQRSILPILVDRCILLMALIVCMDSVFVVENPGGSCILAHPRFQWFIKALRDAGVPVFLKQFNNFFVVDFLVFDGGLKFIVNLGMEAPLELRSLKSSFGWGSTEPPQTNARCVCQTVRPFALWIWVL